jgi:hypothetical protein
MFSWVFYISRWCTILLYSHRYSSIWRMQNVWQAVDRLCRNSHWRSPVISCIMELTLTEECWRVQVLTAASRTMTAFWNIVPCSLVEVDRRFRGAYCFHHQENDEHTTHLRNFNEITWYYIPEGYHYGVHVFPKLVFFISFNRSSTLIYIYCRYNSCSVVKMSVYSS